MAGLLETPGSRRKRVLRACDPCRSMKSKCDGIHPVCGRCTGYGYRCVYSVSEKRRSKLEHVHEEHHEVPTCSRLAEALRQVLDDYDRLAVDTLASLPLSDQAAASDRLAGLRLRVSELFRAEGEPVVRSSPPQQQQQQQQMPVVPAPVSFARPTAVAERYLGEVSDVRFFNLIDRALQEKNEGGSSCSAEEPGSGAALDSYEQDEPSSGAATVAAVQLERLAVALPPADAAERYLDVYFSTIHMAYPFIPRALFVRTYHRYRATGRTADANIDSTWLATLYVLFAIGAYYISISGDTGDKSHEQYYRHALMLSDADTPERSLGRVSLLLAQCFYLLAACRTDKCWTTLGLAVRVGQSIGLHVDVDVDVDTGTETAPLLLRAESRRRVWYSIYVLDRLLALQLGRPPAIHDDDCHLRLPSRLGDADIDWDGAGEDGLWSPAAQERSSAASLGDYFVCMISLSRIIGHVMRDLYSPPRTRDSIAGWLPSTQALDGQLVEWRRSLPRALRFDLGHTFETSQAFRRQRNMLAIKFHHLRALIYRPYLCLPLLRGRKDKMPDGHSRRLLDRHERTCIAEAQDTAHLLHNVADKESLVHDFPWWQMISCLICASSILVVASVFARRDGTDSGAEDEQELTGRVDVAALEDDAETCLKVFEALGANSDGARIARDMMRRLRTRGRRWRESHGQVQQQKQQQQQDTICTLPAMDNVSSGLPSDPGPSLDPMPMETDISLPGLPLLGQNGEHPLYGEWPSEILDSMAWSAQFFSAVDGSTPQFL